MWHKKVKVGHIWNLHRLRHIQVAIDKLQPAWHFLLLPLWLEVSQQHLKMFSLLKVFENWLKVSHKEILDNIANITLRRGGIWNFAQTPLKNLKTHWKNWKLTEKNWKLTRRSIIKDWPVCTNQAHSAKDLFCSWLGSMERQYWGLRIRNLINCLRLIETEIEVEIYNWFNLLPLVDMSYSLHGS